MSSAPTTVGQLKCQKYKFSLKFLLCVGIFFFQRVQIPYASRYIGKAFVSRKLVVGDDSSEGGVSVEMSGGHFEVIDPTVGQTAIPIAIGTVLIPRQARHRLKQERYMRHICLG